MGVTMLPGAPQFGQSGGQADTTQLVQLAMAVKSFKMQEKEQKRQQAQQKVDLLLKNPGLLVMTDPKDLEKAMKEGFDLKFTDDTPANPQNANQTAPQAKVDPNAIASVANATQGNKAGAQAANPPSSEAANKAPGGGEVNTHTQVTEKLAAEANHAFQEKFNKLAPIYGQAMSQLDLESHKARAMMEIEDVKTNAAKGDMQAMGRLMLLSGKQVSDVDMRAMVVSSNMDPKIQAQALGFALGNETDGDKAKRFDTTLKTLASSPEFMGRLARPEDVAAYARSIVYSGRLPEGISVKPHTLAELTNEAAYEKTLIGDVGLPYDIAHTIARGRTDGIEITASMPKGFQTIAQREAGAKETQASAALTGAEAELQRLKNDGLKIQSELSAKPYEDLNDRLRMMTEASKAKHPWPQDVQDALLNEVAVASHLMPERVNNFFHFLTGGAHWEYKQNPDSDLAKSAAGGGANKPGAATKRSPTLAESGGLVGAIGRHTKSMKAGDMNPLSLEHQLVTAGRDRALQYIKDIFLGKDLGPK
jgi:hypothetical protein